MENLYLVRVGNLYLVKVDGEDPEVTLNLRKALWYPFDAEEAVLTVEKYGGDLEKIRLDTVYSWDYAKLKESIESKEMEEE